MLRRLVLARSPVGTSRRFLRGAAPLSSVLIYGTGCGPMVDPSSCTKIGPDGGLLQSADSILSVAIPAGALTSEQEYCVTKVEVPLPSQGPAYHVQPDGMLAVPASVTYRHQLPSDTSEINIGHITAEDWAADKGEWISLGQCRIDEASSLVRCVDPTISPFYTLLDGRMGAVSDSVGGGDSGDTGSNVTGGQNDTDSGMTGADDTGPEIPPIDYPPECDNLFRGPYTPVHVGPIFERNINPAGGAEDMAPDGQGGFVGRSGMELVRLDVTQATLGVAEDPGFSVQPLLGLDLFTETDTLGIRYLSNGDLGMLQRGRNRFDVLHPDGTITTVAPDLDLPNGLYADTQGNAWFSEYLGGGNISRYNAGSGQVDAITQIAEANGLVYDPLRGMLFYVNYTPSQVWRLPISATGAPGRPAMVADLDGFSDGVAMDVCGNLYVVDQGNQSGESRLDRVFMTDGGELVEVEEIAQFPTELANINFGYGEAYGDFQTAAFLTGIPGDVYYVDLQITGAPVPTLDAPPDTGYRTLPYTQDFTGANGDPWPSPWARAGDNIATATIEGERGQFSAINNTGRMILPNFSETNVDVVVSVLFDNFAAQGFGFYVRQNGGALDQTSPRGQGYGVYVEGGLTPGGDLGVWREIDGVETRIQGGPPPVSVQSGVMYRIRFQCEQMGTQTALRARMWRDGDPEPGAWTVDIMDDAPELQNVAASFSADTYNYTGSANVAIDDLEITAL